MLFHLRGTLRSAIVLMVLALILFGNYGFSQEQQPRHLKDEPFEKIQAVFDEKITSFERASTLLGLNELLLADFSTEQKNILKIYKLRALVENEFYDEALKLANEMLEDPELSADFEVQVLLERAWLYELLGDMADGKKDLNRIARIYEETFVPKDENYGKYLFRLSSWYRNTGRKAESIKLAEAAVHFGNKFNFLDVQATGNLLLGLNTDSAKTTTKRDYFFKSIDLWKRKGHEPGVTKMYHFLSKTYLKDGNLELALTYNDSALALIDKYETSFLRPELYQQRSQIFEMKDDIKEALRYQKLFAKEESTQLRKSRNLKVREYEYEFNKEKAVLENIKLETKLESLNRTKYYLTVGVIGGSIFLITLICLFLALASRNQKIKEQNSRIITANLQLSQTLEEKEFLLQEVNHRVKNNLAFIQSLIAFQMEESAVAESVEDLKSLNNRIQAIATVHDQFIETENSVAHKEVPLGPYLAAIADALLQVKGEDAQYSQEIEDVRVNIETAVPLGILINELVTNSIKHAQPLISQVVMKLKITESEDQLLILYNDNGKEFLDKETEQSLGLYIISTMVKQLRGSLERVGSNYQILVKRKRQ